MGGFTCLAPAVQDALATEIRSVIEAASDDVVFGGVGHPGKALSRRHLWISSDFRAKHPRRTSGGRQRDDEATFTAAVYVVKAVDDPLVVRNDAMAIGKYIEDAIAANPKLGGLVDQIYVSQTEGDEGITGSDRQYGLTFTIAYSSTAARSG